MRIGIPKEHANKEHRVAVTPIAVEQLIRLGFTVCVEQNAGKLANFEDNSFIAVGAKIFDSFEIWKSDILLKINIPTDKEIMLMKNNSILISFIWPAQNLDLLVKLKTKNITVIAMDAVPRISRAQSLDALSSMANISGYCAVIEAAYEFRRFFAGQITAAGKISPAKVMVIGAGVAGLAAINTARSLGAIVQVFDIRQEVKEQAQSMGVEFLELDFQKNVKNDFEYNKISSEDLIKAEQELFYKHVNNIDIIITTAFIYGKSAPRLINKNMVASMKSGSVIVDLAAQMGGNCDLTVADEIVITDNNVKIIGYTNLPSRMPTQSSELYAKNLVNLLKILCKEKNGLVIIDFEDPVIRSMTVIYNGKLTWSSSPAPVFVKSQNASKETIVKITKEIPKISVLSISKYKIIIALIFLFCILFSLTTQNFLLHLTIFALSSIVGYYVVCHVTPALHTPLMAVTNAISGIVIIGALFQVNYGGLISFLSLIAILIASINIFGGFIITRRILKMFRKY